MKWTRVQIVGLSMLLLFIAFADAGPMAARFGPIAFEGERLSPPTAIHWLGTNSLGQDLFSQLAYGARSTLAIGLMVAVLSTALSGVLGLAAGYSKRLDPVINAVANVLLVIPSLLLILIVIAFTRGGIGQLVLTLGLLTWPGYMRLIRASVLSLREREFVKAAQLYRAKPGYILRRHLLPFIMPLLRTKFLMSFRQAVATEAGLSFLGLGDPNHATWGKMLEQAFQQNETWLTAAWQWTVLPPVVSLLLVTVSLAMLGEGVARSKPAGWSVLSSWQGTGQAELPAVLAPASSAEPLATLAVGDVARPPASLAAAGTPEPPPALAAADAPESPKAVAVDGRLEPPIAPSAAGAPEPPDTIPAPVSVSAALAAPAAVSSATGPALRASVPAAAVAADSLRVAYDGQAVLHPLSFALAAGSITAVVGESGSGKTTLARTLYGLQPEHTVQGDAYVCGRRMYGGRPGMKRWQDAAFIFQDARLSLNPLLTIGRQLQEVLPKGFPSAKRARREAAAQALREVQLEERVLDCYPHELSGGMLSRVVIALALINKPSVLIADEPTGALDPIVKQEIMELLVSKVRQHGMTLVLITHDIGTALYAAEEVMILKDGRLLEHTSKQRWRTAPQNGYSKELLGSYRRRDRRCMDA